MTRPATPPPRRPSHRRTLITAAAVLALLLVVVVAGALRGQHGRGTPAPPARPPTSSVTPQST